MSVFVEAQFPGVELVHFAMGIEAENIPSSNDTTADRLSSPDSNVAPFLGEEVIYECVYLFQTPGQAEQYQLFVEPQTCLGVSSFDPCSYAGPESGSVIQVLMEDYFDGMIFCSPMTSICGAGGLGTIAFQTHGKLLSIFVLYMYVYVSLWCIY